MAHKPSFAVGAVVSNDEMRKELCGEAEQF